MFNNSKKKIQILQDELYITRLENASLRSRLAKATPKKETAKKTTTKKEAK
jgi:regulator of replication initiation timing